MRETVSIGKKYGRWLSFIPFFNIQLAVLGMLFQQLLYNVEDTVSDFQHEAHKSAILCSPRRMKENLWTSGFYVAIKAYLFWLEFSLALACELVLSCSLSLSFFLVKSNKYICFYSDVISANICKFSPVSSAPVKQNGSLQETGKVGLVPSVSSAMGHQFAPVSSSCHMTLTPKVAWPFFCLFFCLSSVTTQHSSHIFVTACFPNSTAVLNSS